MEERKRRQELEEENKYDLGIIKSYKTSTRKGVNGAKSLSKRNLNQINAKNKRVNGTPINYEHSKKRVSQPIGFGKKQSSNDFEVAGQHKVRKSFAMIGASKQELLKNLNSDIRSPSNDQ